MFLIDQSHVQTFIAISDVKDFSEQNSQSNKSFQNDNLFEGVQVHSEKIDE